MRIFIITMEDPVYTLPFIKEIIEQRKDDIVGVATAEGDRLKIGKKRSKLVYVFTLLVIMGPLYFIKYSAIGLIYKLKKLMAKAGLMKSPSILAFASSHGIPVWKLKSPNNKSFLKELEALKPDVVIHQSQNIVKQDLLDIPSIGMLNRHNALLPKNRGRLTPFWVLYKKETETGVSIHFVEKGLDSGEIVVQEKFPVERGDGFNTIVKKNYQIAPKAMLKAIDLLEAGQKEFIPNDDDLATYNSVPRFMDALRYRFGLLPKTGA